MTFSFAVEILSYILLASVFLFYLAYYLLLRRYHTNARDVKNNANPGPRFFPMVSMIIPVYNEGKTIQKKLENIKSLRYPEEKLEAIFVDGCSTDKTAEIIQSYIDNECSFMRLVQQECRKGYNEGVVDGLAVSSGEIVVLTDAGAYYDPDALRYLVGHFEDPQVGAVTGREVVANEDGVLAAKLESTYRSFYDFMRSAEAKMDSTPDLKGELSAVRKKICVRTAEKVRKSPNASFDCCVPYQARMEGHTVVYEGEAFYSERAPATFRGRMRQQVRRGTILIAALLLFKDMIFDGKYGKFGTVILPAHLMMLVVLPWVFLSGVATFVVATVMDPIMNVVALGVFVVPILLSSRVRLFVVAFVQSQLALVAALWRVVMRRESLFIETIPSTRVCQSESREVSS